MTHPSPSERPHLLIPSDGARGVQIFRPLQAERGKNRKEARRTSIGERREGVGQAGLKRKMAGKPAMQVRKFL